MRVQLQSVQKEHICTRYPSKTRFLEKEKSLPVINTIIDFDMCRCKVPLTTILNARLTWIQEESLLIKMRYEWEMITSYIIDEKRESGPILDGSYCE